MSATRAWWPHLRAAFLCLFVLGNLLYALPFPRKRVEEDRRDTWRRDDLDMWFEWIGGVVPYDRQGFGDAVIDGSNGLYELGQWVHSPVKPFFRTLRTTQQWGLFGIVAEAPEALVVEAMIDGEWIEIERRLHPDNDWRDPIFRYRRVRGTWDSVRKDQPAPLYDAFCRWTAQMAFADYPRATRVRVSRHRFFVMAPWEHDVMEPKVINDQEFTREQSQLWVVR